MLEDLPRPIIFAHRGDSAHAPENTLASFRLAEVKGAEAIELDAQLSADGQLVVFHDATLGRTTDGTGRLSEKNFDELRTLDAGNRFGGNFRGVRIPLLDEVLETVGKRLVINIEFKRYFMAGDALVQSVCEAVRKHAIESRIIFSSFHAPSLQMAARLLPQVPRGLLARPRWAGAWARSFGFSFGDYLALHPNLADASPQQVRRVHRLGRRIHVWTVRRRDQIQRLIDWDVDGIFTDDPEMALQVAGRRT
jgi:glycerophosphoryl diester phosphodiesterase